MADRAPKSIAIVQPSYIPWKGFFDLVNGVDELVLYEDVQFTKRDWRSRNYVKTAQGAHLLTIPCDSKGKYNQLICQTKISDSKWAATHWKTIQHAYSKAPHFDAYRGRFEMAYRDVGGMDLLSDVNRRLFETIRETLAITTKIADSRDYPGEGAKTDRLLSVCLAAGATHYLSGPSARDYMELDKFAAHGVSVEFMDYSGYPEYPQLFPPFVHAVSVLDLLFNTGPEARRYMKSFGVGP